MNKIKIYSPGQAGMSAFVGGPLAMIYVLKKNFDALGNPAASKKVLLWGLLFTVLLLLVLPFLPEKFPSYILPIIYVVAARQIAEGYQMSKKAIQGSEQFGFESNWKVLGISIGFFFAFLAIALVWILSLQGLGVIHLR
jgi:hypothetical protein